MGESRVVDRTVIGDKAAERGTREKREFGCREIVACRKSEGRGENSEKSECRFTEWVQQGDTGNLREGKRKMGRR